MQQTNDYKQTQSIEVVRSDKMTEIKYIVKSEMGKTPYNFEYRFFNDLLFVRVNKEIIIYLPREFRKVEINRLESDLITKKLIRR